MTRAETSVLPPQHYLVLPVIIQPRKKSTYRKLTEDQTVSDDSSVQAISNVQRIQQCLWLIILFPLPSPADFVQVFYGYLEALENRQKEDFANFFCLGLWILYTDGGQPQASQLQAQLPSLSEGKHESDTVFSQNTVCNMYVVKVQDKITFLKEKRFLPSHIPPPSPAKVVSGEEQIREGKNK